LIDSRILLVLNRSHQPEKALRNRNRRLENQMVRWYYWASAFYLLAGTSSLGIVSRFVYGEVGGGKINQSFNLLFIVTSLSLFSRAYRRTRRIGVSGILAMVVAGYLLLSALWSMDAGTAMTQGVLYMSLVVGAIGIAANLDSDEFMGLLVRICFLSAVGSLVLLEVNPRDAMMPDAHNLRGIYSHKNILGQVMTVGALATLYGLRVGGFRRLGKFVALILFAGIALASGSATCFLTIFVFCFIEVIISLIQKGGAVRIGAYAAIALLAPIIAFVVIFPDSLLEMIGKEPTLTGRTDLWAYVLINIFQRPLLGWGYMGFWTPSNPMAVEISRVLNWTVPQAHNGLLEILLNVGFVGAALFIFIWAKNVRLALQCMRTPENALAISTLAICGMIVMIGVTENVLLSPAQPMTSVFFITGMMCERALKAARRRRYPVVRQAV